MTDTGHVGLVDIQVEAETEISDLIDQYHNTLVEDENCYLHNCYAADNRPHTTARYLSAPIS